LVTFYHLRLRVFYYHLTFGSFVHAHRFVSDGSGSTPPFHLSSTFTHVLVTVPRSLVRSWISRFTTLRFVAVCVFPFPLRFHSSSPPRFTALFCHLHGFAYTYHRIHASHLHWVWFGSGSRLILPSHTTFRFVPLPRTPGSVFWFSLVATTPGSGSLPHSLTAVHTTHTATRFSGFTRLCLHRCCTAAAAPLSMHRHATCTLGSCAPLHLCCRSRSGCTVLPRFCTFALPHSALPLFWIFCGFHLHAPAGLPRAVFCWFTRRTPRTAFAPHLSFCTHARLRTPPSVRSTGSPRGSRTLRVLTSFTGCLPFSCTARWLPRFTSSFARHTHLHTTHRCCRGFRSHCTPHAPPPRLCCLAPHWLHGSQVLTHGSSLSRMGSHCTSALCTALPLLTFSRLLRLRHAYSHTLFWMHHVPLTRSVLTTTFDLHHVPFLFPRSWISRSRSPLDGLGSCLPLTTRFSPPHVTRLPGLRLLLFATVQHFMVPADHRWVAPAARRYRASAPFAGTLAPLHRLHTTSPPSYLTPSSVCWFTAHTCLPPHLLHCTPLGLPVHALFYLVLTSPPLCTALKVGFAPLFYSRFTLHGSSPATTPACVALHRGLPPGLHAARHTARTATHTTPGFTHFLGLHLRSLTCHTVCAHTASPLRTGSACGSAPHHTPHAHLTARTTHGSLCTAYTFASGTAFYAAHISHCTLLTITPLVPFSLPPGLVLVHGWLVLRFSSAHSARGLRFAHRTYTTRSPFTCLVTFTFGSHLPFTPFTRFSFAVPHLPSPFPHYVWSLTFTTARLIHSLVPRSTTTHTVPFVGSCPHLTFYVCLVPTPRSFYHVYRSTVLQFTFCHYACVHVLVPAATAHCQFYCTHGFLFLHLLLPHTSTTRYLGSRLGLHLFYCTPLRLSACSFTHTHTVGFATPLLDFASYTYISHHHVHTLGLPHLYYTLGFAPPPAAPHHLFGFTQFYSSPHGLVHTPLTGLPAPLHTTALCTFVVHRLPLHTSPTCCFPRTHCHLTHRHFCLWVHCLSPPLPLPAHLLFSAPAFHYATLHCTSAHLLFGFSAFVLGPFLACSYSCTHVFCTRFGHSPCLQFALRLDCLVLGLPLSTWQVLRITCLTGCRLAGLPYGCHLRIPHHARTLPRLLPPCACLPALLPCCRLLTNSQFTCPSGWICIPLGFLWIGFCYFFWTTGLVPLTLFTPRSLHLLLGSRVLRLRTYLLRSSTFSRLTARHCHTTHTCTGSFLPFLSAPISHHHHCSSHTHTGSFSSHVFYLHWILDSTPLHHCIHFTPLTSSPASSAWFSSFLPPRFPAFLHLFPLTTTAAFLVWFWFAPTLHGSFCLLLGSPPHGALYSWLCCRAKETPFARLCLPSHAALLRLPYCSAALVLSRRHFHITPRRHSFFARFIACCGCAGSSVAMRTAAIFYLIFTAPRHSYRETLRLFPLDSSLTTMVPGSLLVFTVHLHFGSFSTFGLHFPWTSLPHLTPHHACTPLCTFTALTAPFHHCLTPHHLLVRLHSLVCSACCTCHGSTLHTSGFWLGSFGSHLPFCTTTFPLTVCLSLPALWFTTFWFTTCGYTRFTHTHTVPCVLVYTLVYRSFVALVFTTAFLIPSFCRSTVHVPSFGLRSHRVHTHHV